MDAAQRFAAPAIAHVSPVAVLSPDYIRNEAEWRAFELDAWMRAHIDRGLKTENMTAEFARAVRERTGEIAPMLRRRMDEIANRFGDLQQRNLKHWTDGGCLP